MTLLRSLHLSRWALRKLSPCPCSLTRRTLHHTYEYQPSVDLEWDVQAPSIGTEGPLIILHGLLSVPPFFTALIFLSDKHLYLIAAQRGTGNHSVKPSTAPCPPDQFTPSTFGTTARRRTRHHIRTRAWRLMSSDSLKNMSSKTLRCWGILCGYLFRSPFFLSH